LTVGKQGKLAFKRGYYAYVGSAQNNLEKRIQRHLKKQKTLFWHIDYLLESQDSNVIKVFYKEAGKSEECSIAERLKFEGDAVSGFGSSDCHCSSHLFHIENYSFLKEFMHEYPF
jgi:Uri superfamily endonuclease